MTRIKKADHCSNFVEAYNNYFRTIYNQVRFYVKDDNVAYDLTQCVFIKSYQKQVHCLPWLKRVAINQSLDYLRELKRRRESELFEQHVYEYMQFGEVYILIILNEIRKQLRKIGTPLQCNLFEYLWEDLTYEEIARKTHLKIPTIYVYISELKKIIEKIIKELAC